ncbi:MAG TPA: hypothetical protein PLW75_00610 [Hyphomicrobium sp.]|nr:hypothetical protein [Hyphomicrobium sp.]
MKAVALALGILAAMLGGRTALSGAFEAKPVIGGVAMTCRDFRGRIVQTLNAPLRGDVGRATFIATVPVIALDPVRLATLPEKMRIFFYQHECAHHVLAHIFNPTIESEREADCWSIGHGRTAGHFTREDVEAFAPFLAHSRGSPFGHLPGPERHAHLLACYDAPDTSRAAYNR